MSAEFNFDDEQWQSFLKKLNIKWKDIQKRKEFGALVSSIAFSDIIQHFEKEVGPDGKWKGWSEVYRQHMNRIGKGGNKILQDTGRLRGSLMPGGKGKHRSSAEGVTLYTKVQYAAAHQDGSDNMPARPFMWLSSNGMERLIKATGNWLLED